MTCLPCEETMRSCHLWPRKLVLTGHRIYWHFDPEFPTSRTVRNKFLVYKLLRLGYIVIADWADKVIPVPHPKDEDNSGSYLKSYVNTDTSQWHKLFLEHSTYPIYFGYYLLQFSLLISDHLYALLGLRFKVTLLTLRRAEKLLMNWKLKYTVFLSKTIN